MATIRDVAEKVGVSPTTVSRVLNNNPNVRPELRELILQAARDVNYQPNMVARNLVSQKSNLIGIVIPDIAAPFLAETVRAIADIAALSGYNTVVINTDWDLYKEQEAIKVLHSRKIDGILILPSEIEPHLDVLKKAAVPTVVIYRHSPDFDSVETDHVKAGAMVAEHFADIGHVRMAYLGNEQSPKFKGFKSGALNRHILERDILIWSLVSNAAPFETAYKIAVEQLQNLESRPTAVFAKNDLVAAGVVRAAKDVGLCIPKDLAVVGFDNTVVAPILNPALTSVSSPKYEVGRISTELLLERISGGDHFKPRYIKIEPRLAVRESSIERCCIQHE